MQKNKIINVQNLPITISKEEIDDLECDCSFYENEDKNRVCRCWKTWTARLEKLLYKDE